jgi:hypothetical protein
LNFFNYRKEVCGYEKVKVLEKMEKCPNKVKKERKRKIAHTL